MKNKSIEFQLDEEFIELIKLLKLLRIAESGGQAKMFVDNGEVVHNGEIESRKRAKIRKGDSVEIFDFVIKIQ
jgi:ribosome-associated protein